MAFIGYRDVQDKGRFVEHEFTQNITEIKDLLSTFQSNNNEQNEDEQGDVAGALKLCLMQDWTEEAVKYAILISDSPAHGFFPSQSAKKDKYP